MAETNIGRINKILKDKEMLETNSGLVFVHPYSPVGQKAISEAYGPRCGNEDVVAVHNGKLYSTVERISYAIGDRWRGRLAEHVVTDTCLSLEMCLDTILQRYQEELSTGNIDSLIRERWYTPDMTTEEVEELISQDLKEMFGDNYLNILDDAIEEMNKDNRHV